MAKRRNSIATVLRWLWRQSWFAEGPWPSAREISRVSGYSLRQILRALRELQRLGLIEIRHGRGIASRVEDCGAKEVLRVSTDAVTETAARARKLIEEGVWRSGDFVPKVSGICREWRVSTRTLAKAFRQLEQTGIMSKEGKFWKVGPAQQFVSREVSVRENPVILIVSERSEEWSAFYGNLLDGFVRGFGAEADRCQVRLIPVQTGEARVPVVFTAGKRLISQLATTLGNRYRGALFTPLRSAYADFDEWCRWLCRLGRPVVVLQDNVPEQGVSGASRLYRMHYGDWVLSEDEHAVDFALRALAERGHCRVLFPCGGLADRHWCLPRAQRLVSRAAIWNVRVIVREMSEDPQEIVSIWWKERSCTAILAPNDLWALRYWEALRRLGVRIPEEVSLLSFDNRAELKPYPISTIDFGMAALGYQAFHLILGDIPVRVRASGRLVGQCALIDNGSLGKARDF